MEEQKRKYQEIWEKLLLKGPTEVYNPPQDKVVKIKIPSKDIFPRIRKAVWKEKDLDKVNRSKYRCHCEYVEVKIKDGLQPMMLFWITENLTSDMV